MADERTLYDAIGVPTTATPWEIRQACLRLGDQCRPDEHANNPESSARFAEIEKAFETLTDSEKRAHYDQELRNKASPPGVLAYLGLFILLVLVPLHFIGFMYQWFTNSYETAKQAAPLGYVLFWLAAGVVYVVAIPKLARRGHSRLAAAMFFVGAAVAVMALLWALGWLPFSRDCELARGGYVCR
jgi:curved DNA-binding protein CbpA